MNTTRTIPIAILIVILLIGLLDYLFKSRKIDNKMQFTVEYQQKFIEYTNGLLKNVFNQELYVYLTENVNKMQFELGNDGVFAYMQDGLTGISAKNYQILVNTLPATHEFYRNSFMNNEIAWQRIDNQCNSCCDSFLRHIGNLKDVKAELNQDMKNPIKLFSNGVSLVISSPLILLKQFGIISDGLEYSLTKNVFFKFISSLVAFIGFLSDIISIAIGWDGFVEFISRFLQ